MAKERDALNDQRSGVIGRNFAAVVLPHLTVAAPAFVADWPPVQEEVLGGFRECEYRALQYRQRLEHNKV